MFLRFAWICVWHLCFDMCVSVKHGHEKAVRVPMLLQSPVAVAVLLSQGQTCETQHKGGLLYLHAYYIKAAFVTACMLMTVGVYSAPWSPPPPSRTTAYTAVCWGHWNLEQWGTKKSCHLLAGLVSNNYSSICCIFVLMCSIYMYFSLLLMSSSQGSSYTYKY